MRHSGCGRVSRASRFPLGAAGLSLACALLLARGQALAQCATTGTNQTCTNPAGTIVSGGGIGIFDTAILTLTNFGTVTGANFAIEANTADVINSGIVSGGNFGIVAARANVTNSGTISGGATGIFAPITATVTNSGTISGAAFGIQTLGATVANSGTISGGGNGIQASSATVTNSGTISGGAFGIKSSTATVTNSGTISGGNFGIAAQFATVTNSGTISGATGIIAVFFPSTLVNSGAIVGTAGPAIDFSASNQDTLTFLPGSSIQGAVLLGPGDSVNVVTGAGVSSLLTVTPNGPFTLSAGGAAPFVVAGNQVATLDPTPFGLADKTLMDFTRGISGILGSLGGASAPSGPPSSAFAPSDSIAARVDDAFAGLGIPALAYASDQAMVFKNPTRVASDGRAVWARGFGGERIQDADGVLLRATNLFVGGAVGFDMAARPDLRLGLFVGGGQSRLSVDQNAGNTNTDTAFGGVYGRWSFTSLGAPSFLDVALHGGRSTNATSRTINNNLAPGGIEVATASYDSSYVSPELAFGINLPVATGYTLTPSLQLRYVAGLFGGFTETGSAANLTVAGRTIQDAEERGELALTRATPVGPDILLTSVHIGVLGLERAGDATVNAVLLGAGLPFVTPGRSAVAGVVGGGGIEWRTREGVSMFGAAEAIGFSDQSTVWSARGGIRAAF